jgi:hypothetical protein
VTNAKGDASTVPASKEAGAGDRITTAVELALFLKPKNTSESYTGLLPPSIV